MVLFIFVPDYCKGHGAHQAFLVTDAIYQTFHRSKPWTAPRWEHMASLQRTETALPAEFRCSSWSFFSLFSEESTRCARCPSHFFFEPKKAGTLTPKCLLDKIFLHHGVDMLISITFTVWKTFPWVFYGHLTPGERWMPELMFPLGGAKVGTLSYRQLPHLEMPVLNEPG